MLPHDREMIMQNELTAALAEIERLRTALKPFADMAMADLCLPSFPALTELVNHAIRAKAAYEQKVEERISDTNPPVQWPRS